MSFRLLTFQPGLECFARKGISNLDTQIVILLHFHADILAKAYAGEPTDIYGYAPVQHNVKRNNVNVSRSSCGSRIQHVLC